MRLSIEVTPGSTSAGNSGLEGLEKLLHARVAAAERGSLSAQTVDQVIDGVLPTRLEKLS